MMTGVDCRVDWQMRENRKDCFIDFTSMRMLNILVPILCQRIQVDRVCSVGCDVVFYYPRNVGVGAILYLLCIPCHHVLFRIRTPSNHIPSRPTTRRQTRSTRAKIPRHRLPNSRKSRSLRNPPPSPPRRPNVPPPPPPPSPYLSPVTNACVCRFSKLAFIQLPVFAVFLRYKYFNTAYTRTSLRELSGNIDRAVNPLPPAVRDTWIKIRDGIAYYGTRPLVAGEGVPGANAGATTAGGGVQGTASGAQRATSGVSSGSTQRTGGL